MNSSTLAAIEQRAGAIGDLDLVKQLEACTRVRDEIKREIDAGEVLVLSDDEKAMLAEYRRFRKGMKKPAEVFRWMTRRSTEVEIVEDTSFVEHVQHLPCDVL